MLILLKDFYEIILYSELEYNITLKIVEKMENHAFIFEYILSQEISYIDYTIG